MRITSQFENNLTSRITLPEKWVTFLIDKPETGMGYQSVIVSLQNGATINGFVTNCEVLETLFPISTEDIVDIKVNPKEGQV